MSASTGYVAASVPECPYAPRMTRAQALALRAANGLLENCVVVITDGPTIGNAITGTSPTEIELNPVASNDLGLTARVNTTFDDSSWAGLYDIDLGTAGSITRLTDNLGNTAQDIDADSPTVHTVFPWGVATWRDNYMEDWVSVTPVVGSLNPVANNRFVNGNSLDLTGWTSALFNTISNSEFVQTGILHIQGASAWNGVKARLGSVNSTAGGRITLTDATLYSATITNNATVENKFISVSRSLINGSSLIQNSDVGGGLNVTDSEIISSSSVTIDAAALKSISLTSSSLRATQIQLTGGTVLAGTSFIQCDVIGALAGNEINILGDQPNSINRSVLNLSQTTPWVWDGQAGLNSLNIIDSQFYGMRWDRGPLSGRTDINRSNLQGGVLTTNGAGGCNIDSARAQNFTLDIQTGSTGGVSVTQSIIDQGIIRQLPASTRYMSISDTLMVGQNAIIEGSGTTPLVAPGDRVSNCEIYSNSLIQFAGSGGPAYIIGRTKLHGTSLAQVALVRYDGTSSGVFVDGCDIAGTVTFTNELGMTGPTSFHDNKVGPGSSVLVSGGDATARQIRNNTVEGLSVLNATNLTGTAGAALADIFGCRVDGQSTLAVTGARVVGQPVRNNDLAGASTLNVSANGTALQCSFRNNAVVTTGAFRHSETIVEGAFIKTLTAANVNRLANKSFDDTI